MTSDVKRRYADVGVRQIHYRECGPADDGDQALRTLLLHQVSSSSAMFEAVMPLLAERGIHTLAPDTAGFGASDPLSDPQGVMDYVRDLLNFLDAAGWHEPVFVVGHHNGARRGTELSAEHPERVRALVAVGLPYHPDKQARAQSFVDKKIQDPVPTDDGAHVMHEWQRLGELGGPGMAAPLRTRELVDTLRAQNYAAMYRISFSHDVEHALEALRVPTLLVGPAGDQLAPRQAAAAALAEHAESVEVPGGVFVFDEDPAMMAQVIGDFLWRIEREVP